MHRVVTIILAALMLSACASTSSQSASKVRDGDPATVNRDCKLLGTVTGRSMFGGAENSRVEGAAADAREKAAAMGATDIVIMSSDTSGILNTAEATARAYRCDAKN